MTAHDHSTALARLLGEIDEEARDTASWTGRGRFAPRVMAALARVPRHLFVPADEEVCAYDNRPLPIGHGQTISQPYIVALMTDLLDLAATDRVLEVGTGCGYQAAVLAEVAGRVYSLEVVPELAEGARRRLAELGYRNVEIRCGDGFAGWPEAAPFDAILVTAAPETIPPRLVEQLKPGGRLVVPVGEPFSTQYLYVGRKDAAGAFTAEPILPVAFVPMVRRRTA
jgi:protein-L-isoaspartate(D-aspartate) O-methyltransferase